MENDFLLNLDKLHTTDMGAERIRRNLQADEEDVVKYCHDIILKKDAVINRKGKNWHVHYDNIIITVNAYSFTIITAHKAKK